MKRKNDIDTECEVGMRKAEKNRYELHEYICDAVHEKKKLSREKHATNRHTKQKRIPYVTVRD